MHEASFEGETDTQDRHNESHNLSIRLRRSTVGKGSFTQSLTISSSALIYIRSLRITGYGPKRFPKNPCLRTPRTRTSSTTTARRASSRITYVYAPRAPTRRAHQLNYKTIDAYHKGSACRKHRYFYKTVAANHDSRVCHTHRYLLNYCTRSGAPQTPPSTSPGTDDGYLLNYCTRSGASQTIPSTSPGTDERQQAQLLPAHHPISNSDTVTCPAEASSMDPCSV